MKLKDFIRQFLEHVEVGKNQSLKTVENYSHYLGRFQKWAGDITPKQITLQKIQDFRLFLNRFQDKHGKGLGVKTQNYHIIALRAFLKYLIRNDVETLSPEKIDLAKMPERSVEFLSREELDRLFKAITGTNIRNLRDTAMIETLYSTGLRVSELISLDIKQVDLKRKEFMVRGKGRKNRIVFLSKRAAEKISDYLAKRNDNFAPLFINHSKNVANNILDGEKRRLTRASVENVVRQYALKAGIIKKVTPHTLRHSFATELLINGADIRSVQEMLGHSSITTTQIYTHITNKKLREVHEKYHR